MRRLVSFVFGIVVVGCTGGLRSLPAGSSSPSNSPSVELPGPSESLFASNPYYTCVTNRYVATAADGGSDSNSGTSSSSPWLTLAHANSALPSSAPGYCVNIADGTYSVSSSITIDKGGDLASTTGFTVYRAVHMLGVKLVATSAAQDIIRVGAPYIIFDGLELDGGHYGNSIHGIDSCFSGNSYNGLHHIFVMNSYIHDMGGNGVGNCWAEYYWLIHNRLDANAYNSWNSGISTYEPIEIPGYTPTDYDKKWTPYHNVYVYNRFYNNFTSPLGGPHTDGNGLEYDDTKHDQNTPNTVYAPMALMMGNISWGNGGSGIEIGPTSANADVFNNTVYNNYLDTDNTGTWRGDLAASFAAGVTFKNNIAVSVPGAGILANNSPYLSGNPTDTTNLWANNIAFGASPQMDSPDSFPTASNQLNTDPLLADLSGGNFALCTGVGVPKASCIGPSPAIGTGAVVPYWSQQTAGEVDLGACPHGVTACP
jgi:hypothetical protein